MVKEEAIEHIRKVRGFVPSIGFFEIYKDGQEVPQNVIDYFLSMPIKPSGGFMVIGSKLANKLKDLL